MADYESEGRQKAAEITTEADRAARTREADARAAEDRDRGRRRTPTPPASAPTAYAQDREFYLFLENLRAFQSIVSETRDVLLLSTKHPLLKPLAGPPHAARSGDGTQAVRPTASDASRYRTCF